MKTRTALVLGALSITACRGRAAPPPIVATATGSQADLARDLDDADRRGTWALVRRHWQGAHLRWTVIRHRALCSSTSACFVAAFPVQRPARHGWMPALELSDRELAKIDAGCGDAERCELTFEGVLSDLEVSPELPTSLRFSDVTVIALRKITQSS